VILAIFKKWIDKINFAVSYYELFFSSLQWLSSNNFVVSNCEDNAFGGLHEEGRRRNQKPPSSTLLA
jgi:hypothetical protein